MRERLLALLRVPERPDPPPGAGDNLETFRATKGFFYYSVLAWLPKQIAALWGLLFSLAFFGSIDRFGDSVARAMLPENLQRVSDTLADNFGDTNIGLLFLRVDLFQLINFFEILAVVVFVFQLVFSGLLLKPSWELRWYMVGERALRIRHGLWSVREQTMTIANIQNMTVRQGPVQRLFGFSDLEISTAGGGGQSSSEEGVDVKDSFHVGRFRGLENAAALRDKLRRRLTAAQEAQETTESIETPTVQAAESESSALETPLPAAAGGDLARAARDLLEEARALRREALSQAP